MNLQPLREMISYDNARITTEVKENSSGGKDLYMKGIFIQGDKVNHNQRVYPVNEIAKAVESMTDRLKQGYSILGEADHPEDLQVNIDRVSHMITEMWVDGSDGIGKLKILPTPMGNICKTLLESGVKLGVSSRGSGEVNESSGHVNNFEIITVDIVAQPSAPHAYPNPIYEGLMNMRGGHKVFEVAKEATQDQRVQKYLKEGVLRLIKDLKLK